MTPMISVVDGDLAQRYWFYGHGVINTIAGLWSYKVNLKKELKDLTRLEGPRVVDFIKSANVPGMHEAVGGLFGPVGMIIGHITGKKAANELPVVCFHAQLKDGRSFTAVCFEDVFRDIQEKTGIKIS